MKDYYPESAFDIEKIAFDILKESKAYRKFPTPVEKITSCADLMLDKKVSLHKQPQIFFTRAFEGIGTVSRKVLGLLDFRQKTIYLDLNQNANRNRFIQLHEVVHKVCPWQEAVFRWDDKKTISPDIEELFEREASFFASSVLFQLDVFEEKADKLPLSIKSAFVLADMFGASKQATLRRYVQYSKKRIALLVLEQPDHNGRFGACVRNFFVSPSFVREFGNITWPETCGLQFPFIEDLLRRRKLHEDGELFLPSGSGSSEKFDYHYFDNSYNIFVLMKPTGEKIESRTKIILHSNSVQMLN
jgi:Zn-dependent peptidase ImmA (M78 family)